MATWIMHIPVLILGVAILAFIAIVAEYVILHHKHRRKPDE